MRAYIEEKNIGAPGRPVVSRLFYRCDDGTCWAVLERDRYRARQAFAAGNPVEIIVECPDDQFARLA